MSVDQMRIYILAMYPYSKTWPARVSRMSEQQICAIYFRITGGRR